MSAEKQKREIDKLMAEAAQEDDPKKLQKKERELQELGAWDYARWVYAKRCEIERKWAQAAAR